MSAEATGWVWRHSPYRHSDLLIHLAVADVVNDAHSNRFWMTQEALAAKARVSRATVSAWIQRAIADGLLLLVADRHAAGQANVYELVMPPAVDNAVEVGDDDDADLVKNPDKGRDLVKNPDKGLSKMATTLVKNGDNPCQKSRQHELKRTQLNSKEELKASEPGSDAPPNDPTVEHLCELLADLIEANGSKRPTITKRWRDACRLMIERDGRTPRQVENMIRWCQSNEFWRANILSMPKLREKYDQMRLQATTRAARNDATAAPREYLARRGIRIDAGADPPVATTDAVTEWKARKGLA